MSTIAEIAAVSKPGFLLGRVLSVVVTLVLRSGSPLSIDLLFGFYFALMVLGWAWLRDRALRVLIPCGRRFMLPTTHQCGACHV
jgi:hypothetical protein